LPDRLIIFDYSGTLSPGMAAFARPDNLMQHLKSSGLFTLGVDSKALFWEIINATWTEGSTTGLGYKKVMEARIAALFPDKAIVKQPEIFCAVANFVDAYLNHSCIDEHWRLILKKLSLDKSVRTIIATDHYAEATNAIIRHLAKWDIQAVPLMADAESNIMVANSADMGFYKAQQQFWQMLKDILRQNYHNILLIDDFGQNEQQKDDYGEPIKVNERRQMTVKILREVFAADVESISFVCKDEHIKGLIAETSVKIDQFLLCCGR
jgi:hypothetical protein